MFGLFSRKAASPDATGKPTGPVTLTCAEVRAKLSARAITLVDVREAGEFRSGHIAGAMLVPLSTFAVKAREIPTDKPIVLYCLSGGRSGQALALAARMGLPVTTHMGGGITAWKREGLPVSA
jgi:rhodanese-related sulfurtransferase